MTEKTPTTGQPNYRAIGGVLARLEMRGAYEPDPINVSWRPLEDLGLEGPLSDDAIALITQGYRDYFEQKLDDAEIIPEMNAFWERRRA